MTVISAGSIRQSTRLAKLDDDASGVGGRGRPAAAKGSGFRRFTGFRSFISSQRSAFHLRGSPIYKA
jgi:hypothetical protein